MLFRSRVDDIEELTDTMRAFYILPLMKGRKIGIVTYAGGFGVMGIDACHKSGLKMAEFSSETISRLSDLFPPWQRAGNPADITPAMIVTKKVSPFELQEIAIKTVLDDPEVDAVLYVLYAMPPAFGSTLHQLVAEVAMLHPDKPLVFFFYGPFGAEARADLESKGKTMVFPSPDRAIRALGHIADYSEFRMSF